MFFTISNDFIGLQNQFYGQFRSLLVNRFTGLVVALGDPFLPEGFTFFLSEFLRKPPVKFKSKFIRTFQIIRGGCCSE